MPPLNDQFEVFSGIPVVSANLRNLTFRMAGSRLLRTERSGKPVDAADDVDALAGFDPKAGVLRVLAYNYNHNQNATVNEDVSITIEHMRPAGNSAVAVRIWRLDEDHGNWWKLWQADMAARGMNASSFGRADRTAFGSPSAWTLALPTYLRNQADIDFWNANQERYRRAGEMIPEEAEAMIGSDGRLTLRTSLKPYGVALFEIFPLAVEETRQSKRTATPPPAWLPDSRRDRDPFLLCRPQSKRTSLGLGSQDRFRPSAWAFHHCVQNE